MTTEVYGCCTCMKIEPEVDTFYVTDETGTHEEQRCKECGGTEFACIGSSEE